jgi:ribosome modulation factor
LLVAPRQSSAIPVSAPHLISIIGNITMANPIDSAWSAGHKAGVSGKADKMCPYKKGMAEQAWMKGWAAGSAARSEKQG